MTPEQVKDLNGVFGLKLKKGSENDLFRRTCVKNWKFDKFLGKGAYGRVYAVKNGSKVAVIKLQMSRGDPKALLEEARMQRALHKMGVSPRVISNCYLRRSGKSRTLRASRISRSAPMRTRSVGDASLIHCLAMPMMDGVAATKLERASADSVFVKQFLAGIVQMLNVLQKAKATHGDMHFENIAYREERGKPRFYLIDAGFADDTRHYPYIDALQLVRSTYIFDMKSETRKYLRDAIRDLISRMFDIRLPSSESAIENVFRSNKYYDPFF